MSFLVTLAITLLVVLALRPVIVKHPFVLYAVVFALVAAYYASTLGLVGSRISGVLVILVRRGFVAISLFVIVMYVGVFAHGSKPRGYLEPIRATLAIAACLLIAGHVFSYIVTYAVALLGGTIELGVALAVCCGLALVLLGAVLGATSLRAVRRRMSGQAWIKLQKWAYLFYALMYAHAAFLLIPAAVGGGRPAQVSMIVYTFVFGAYALLRIRRSLMDRRAGEEPLTQRVEELEAQMGSLPNSVQS